MVISHCFKWKCCDKIRIFLSHKYNMECHSGLSKDTFNVRQISGETLQILFQLGIFRSLTSKKHGFQPK